MNLVRYSSLSTKFHRLLISPCPPFFSLFRTLAHASRTCIPWHACLVLDCMRKVTALPSVQAVLLLALLGWQSVCPDELGQCGAGSHTGSATGLCKGTSATLPSAPRCGACRGHSTKCNGQGQQKGVASALFCRQPMSEGQPAMYICT